MLPVESKWWRYHINIIIMTKYKRRGYIYSPLYVDAVDVPTLSTSYPLGSIPFLFSLATNEEHCRRRAAAEQYKCDHPIYLMRDIQYYITVREKGRWEGQSGGVGLNGRRGAMKTHCGFAPTAAAAAAAYWRWEDQASLTPLPFLLPPVLID